MAQAELKIDISQFIGGLNTAVSTLKQKATEIADSTNITLDLNGKEATNQVKQLGGAFNTLKGTTASDINNIKQAMALLVVSGKQGSDEFKKLASELRTLTEQSKKFDDATKAVNASIEKVKPTGLTGQFQELGAGIKGAFSADSISGLITGLGSLSPQITAIIGGFTAIAGGIKAFAEGAIAGGKEFETYETQLTTLMGSTVAAKDRIKELAKFGAETPFELPEIVKAEKVLLGFGLTGQKAMQMTGKSSSDLRKVIGDVAAGTGVKFDELALTFGKFSSGATGEAISRLQELGIVTREELTDVGIQFSKSGQLVSPIGPALTEALKIAQSKFGGGMAALSQTAEGLTSTISDSISMGVTEAGAPIFQAYKQILGLVAEFLSSDFMQGLIAGTKEFLGDALAGINNFANTALPKLKPFADFIGKVLVFYFERFKAVVITTWTIVSEVIGTFISVVIEAFAPLGEALAELGKAFGSAGESSIGFNDILKAAGEIIGAVGKVIITLLLQPLKLIVSALSEAIKMVSGWVQSLFGVSKGAKDAGSSLSTLTTVLTTVKASANAFSAGIKEAGTVLYDFWQRIKNLDFEGAMDVLANGFKRVKDAGGAEFTKTFADANKQAAKDTDDLIRKFDAQIEDLKNNRKSFSEAELKAKKEELTASVKAAEIDERNKQLLTTKIANILRGADAQKEDTKEKKTAYQIAKEQFEKEKELIQNRQKAFEDSKKEAAVARGTKLTKAETLAIEENKLKALNDQYEAAKRIFEVTKNSSGEYRVGFKLDAKEKDAATDIIKTVSGLFDSKVDFEYNIKFGKEQSDEELMKALEKSIEKGKEAVKKTASEIVSIEPKLSVDITTGLAEIDYLRSTIVKAIEENDAKIRLETEPNVKEKLEKFGEVISKELEKLDEKLPSVKIKYKLEREKLNLVLIDDEDERKFREQLINLEKVYLEETEKFADSEAAKAKIKQKYLEDKEKLEKEFNAKQNGFASLAYSVETDLLATLLKTEADMKDKAREDEAKKREEAYAKEQADLEKQLKKGEITLREYQSKIASTRAEADKDPNAGKNPEWVEKLNAGVSSAVEKSLPAFGKAVVKSKKEYEAILGSASLTWGSLLEGGLDHLLVLSQQGLAIAAQTAAQGGDALEAFGRVVLKGLGELLASQLKIAIMGAIFTEVQSKGLLGLATGAVITAALTALLNATLKGIGLKRGTEFVGENDGRVIKLPGLSEDQYLTRLDHGEAVVPAVANRGKNREAIKFIIGGGLIENWVAGNISPKVNQNITNYAVSSNGELVKELKLLSDRTQRTERAIQNLSAVTRSRIETEVHGTVELDDDILKVRLEEKQKAQRRRD